MKNVPEDVQRLIIQKLDRKSSARLGATSKQMKRAVNSVKPPSGSYQKKTGRFQKRFSIKGMSKCSKKHASQFRDLEDIDYVGQFWVTGFGHMAYKTLKKSYARNTLFRDFRSITKDITKNEYWKDLVAKLPEVQHDSDAKADAAQSWYEETKEKKSFRRRVVRLLKMWAQEDASYKVPLQMARRRTQPYTEEEEARYKDKLMDAIIVQAAVLHPADDPTRTILGKNGKPLSLDNKVDMVVKTCTTMLKK
jgi:hypothetical protein